MSKSKKIENQAIQQRTSRVTILFLLFITAITIFLFSVLNTILKKRNIPSHNSTIHDRSSRGSIISSDRYSLSYSYKTYTASIRGASIRPGKRELFIRLFSIYSGLDEVSIRALFYDDNKKLRKRYIRLSRTIPLNTAMRLKALAYKLRRLNVFQSIKLHSGMEVLYGLDIIENGESRQFPLGDVLSPLLGHTRNALQEGYSRSAGKQGLERHYEEYLTSKKDGYFKGKRDVSGTVIHDKNSIKIQREDGLDIHLNIPLALQKRVEVMIDEMKRKIDAEEILVGIMESATGKLLSLATTKRYYPSHIVQKDIPALNPKFSEYPYEAGSVIKPLTLAIALEHNRVSPKTRFNTYNGKMKIGKRRTITDDEKFKSLNATDIIVHSSNVGISQVSWKLSGKQFREGLLKFGIAQSSGIDLSRDLKGTLKNERLLCNKMHRANCSYGYGMTVTFAQLLKAYSAFNNEGLAMTPQIVDYLQNSKGKRYTRELKIPHRQAVSKKTAQQIQKILIKVVNKGTGKKARYEGLEIGGKTGTAHIAKNGKYTSEYHSSFYGFANDAQGHKYTIGVLVIRAKGWHKYFASQSAVPTFKNLVHLLVDQKYLYPDSNAKPEIKEILEIYNFKVPVNNEKNTSLELDTSSVKSLFKIEDVDKKEIKKKNIKQIQTDTHIVSDVVSSEPVVKQPTSVKGLFNLKTNIIKPKKVKPRVRKRVEEIEDLF